MNRWTRWLWQVVPDKGYRAPWWMGYAWQDWARAATVVVVVPLNVPAAIVRACWMFWRFELPMVFSAAERNMGSRRAGQCGAVDWRICTREPGHEGPHHGAGYAWYRQ